MSNSRTSRFNGHYHYLFKSTDFLGGTCYGKGNLEVNEAQSRGTVELDSTKPNSWYCFDTRFDFHLETEVQNQHEVMFSMNLFGGTVRSRAKFDQPIDQTENRFETKVLNGAYEVTGEIKRQPVENTDNDTCTGSKPC